MTLAREAKQLPHSFYCPALFVSPLRQSCGGKNKQRKSIQGCPQPYKVACSAQVVPHAIVHSVPRLQGEAPAAESRPPHVAAGAAISFARKHGETAAPASLTTDIPGMEAGAVENYGAAA